MDGTSDFTPVPELRFDNPPVHGGSTCSQHVNFAMAIASIKTKVDDYTVNTSDSINGLEDTIETLRTDIGGIKTRESARDARIESIQTDVADVKLDMKDVKKDVGEVKNAVTAISTKIAMWTGSGVLGGGGILLALYEAYKTYKGG